MKEVLSGGHLLVADRLLCVKGRRAGAGCKDGAVRGCVLSPLAGGHQAFSSSGSATV